MFFIRHKTAYEMRISDCSSDVCSSDLEGVWGSSSTTNSDSGVFWRATPAALKCSMTSGRLSPAPGSRRTKAATVSPYFSSGRATTAVSATAGCRMSRSRSEERRVGYECVRTGRSRWASYPYKTNKKYDEQEGDEWRY